MKRVIIIIIMVVAYKKKNRGNNSVNCKGTVMLYKHYIPSHLLEPLRQVILIFSHP